MINIFKNSNKGKYGYSGCGIEFDAASSWSFGNNFVMILSFHTDNRVDKVLVLDEGPTNDINGSVGAAEQEFSINFSKAKKFRLSLP